MADIINLKHYVDALRNSGYKNTESALAEIVDNSIEADAKNIMIICTTKAKGKRVVNDIGILDSGNGMNLKALEGCLSLGEGTRRERKGMGRFGIGLPQASLHVAPRVEVYSWQKPGEVYYVELDIEEIKNGNQSSIEKPIKKEVPREFAKFISGYKIDSTKFEFSNSGTLVIWKGCDRLSPKTAGPLFDRFEFLLGRKFRKYIEKGVNLACVVAGEEQYDKLIRPNDPLYLMKNNQVLGHPDDPKTKYLDGESIFELWVNGGIKGEVDYPITYLNTDGKKQQSTVGVKFSIAKEIYQAGSTPIGTHCKKNVGISILRAGREVDFGKFDFFEDVNEPQHRWWGCEISFGPQLDEVFKVSCTKQQVELTSMDSDGESEDVPHIWNQLEKIVETEIDNMYKHITKRKKGTRKKSSDNRTPEEKVVDILEGKNGADTASGLVKQTLTESERLEKAKKELIGQGNPNPSKEEIKALIEPKVKLIYKDLGDSPAFIDISMVMGNCQLIVNNGSLFYRELYSKLEDNPDSSVVRAFNLLLMAFARAEDEAGSNDELKDAFQQVRHKWGEKIWRYLKSDYKA